MPLYKFRSDPCQTTFEVRASFHEKEQGLEPTCPKCRGRNVEQVMTTGLFIGQNNASNPVRNAGACRPNASPGCCGR
jgi:putative FmdB family regulatory protein